MSDERVAVQGPTAQPAKKSVFEWWMVSNFAVGAGFAAFVALLIPPYMTEVTGSAADAGIVMMFINLAAVAAPVIGRAPQARRGRTTCRT
jgi:hypothetical protein